MLVNGEGFRLNRSAVKHADDAHERATGKTGGDATGPGVANGTKGRRTAGNGAACGQHECEQTDRARHTALSSYPQEVDDDALAQQRRHALAVVRREREQLLRPQSRSGSAARVQQR